MIRLALFQRCSLAEVSRRYSAAELAELQALDRVEPWSDRRGDFQAAVVATAIAAVHGCKLKPRDFVLGLDDFLETDPPARQQSPEEMLEILKGFAQLQAARA